MDLGYWTRPLLPVPQCRVKLVCGPPAAGKSTHVALNSNENDIVIDFDAIAREHGFGRDRNLSPIELLLVLKDRNGRLAALANEPQSRLAWVIIGLPSERLRRWWCDALAVKAGDLIVLVPTRDELQRRIISDPEREPIAGRQMAVVDRWLRREHDNDPGNDIGLGMA